MISKNFNLESAMRKETDYVPFSLRLSAEERAMLKARSKSKSVSAYIREQLFGDKQTPRQYKLRRPDENMQLLAKSMGELGKSRLASNLNQIAKAANMGALPVSLELEDELFAACDAIQDMRDLLVKALGLKPKSRTA
ncbi:plasmid mobilization relaxosome protein MobC [Ponticaulis koreensis]|uniref:plasmid mobilization relaxosome protein MobC n=1 Tax=Ponticaulis koreensis TaxID=1123045 RepID=UPI0003B5E6AF|nr:plasmid mobilization relaxosome protein MobC [Ponticaulis koreensis]